MTDEEIRLRIVEATMKFIGPIGLENVIKFCATLEAYVSPDKADPSAPKDGVKEHRPRGSKST